VKLVVATSQFAVGADPAGNTRNVLRQMRLARSRGADVVHFCEGALSGYAGTDFESFDGFDWEVLEAGTREVMRLAGELGLWVVVGSSHRLTRGRKPHNSLYVIDDRGALVDRYDKRFCSGDRAGRAGDLAHYTPGDHESVFSIRGVRCGALVCYDFRFPELHRDYKRRGVEVVFHSFHAANIGASRLGAMRRQVGAENHRFNRGTTYPEIMMPAAMQTAAASSHLWISCSNSSAPHSCWPAFFVRADGVVTGRLRRNRAGILLTTVDTNRALYDSTEAWRDRAMDGVLHSGRLVDDVRSRNRTEI